MRPELGQRLAAALREMQSLAVDDVESYLRALHNSDPEVAERLSALSAPARAEGAGPTKLDVRPDAAEPDGPVLGEATASADVRATASFPDAGGAAPDPRDDAPGGPVLGRYRLLRVVGQGAFGEVWQAFDPVLQKHVAVKVSRPDRPLPAGAFLDEARKAASLRHHAIVQVYDAGATADGWHIVSEFIDGDSLRARLAAGRVPPDRAARIAATVAGALHAAHLAGLVHRDVKPANILLDAAGNAYLTDFGLAVREEDQFAQRNTVSGTLAYMAPEQIRGDAHLLDGRADIYALGAVLYELLTGRPLFRAGDLAEYRELILRREPRPPRAVDPAVPEELERICLKCLAKEVRDRYRTAQDMAAELEAWLAGSARTAPAPGRSRRAWTRAAAVGGCAALALAAGGLAVAPFGGREPRTQPPVVPVVPVVMAPPVAPAPKVPAVRELFWNGINPVNKWEVLDNGVQLRVHTEQAALLKLGETGATDWTFTATLHQLGRGGRFGLFLGHARDAAAGTARFEHVSLTPFGAETDVQRLIESYRPEAPAHIAPAGAVCAGVPLKDRPKEVTIRLVVSNGYLGEVRVNGVALPGLLKGAAGCRRLAAGAFGVYNRNSAGVVSNPLFNDAPIPLLVDPAAPQPERP